MDAYGRVDAAWRKAAGGDWLAYQQHAFVRGLGDGSLPRRSFFKFLEQDYHYLLHYSRAWALGVTKAGTPREMSLCADMARALLAGEAESHLEFCREAGVDPDSVRHAREELETIAYTRYVLDAGHSGDFLDLMATVAPCTFGYGWIGRTLTAGATSDIYRPWIDGYGGTEFQNSCNEFATVLDAAVEERLGKDFTASRRWPALCERFRTASWLEANFFSMGFRGGA